MERIQRKRSKGFRLPQNTVCVNRGTKWGNPFKVEKKTPEAHREAIEKYKSWLSDQNLDLSELEGKNLACFCPLDMPCHADYLLQIANQ